ncbi:MAG TPA: NADPH-dependent F420 reductase [Acidimicrobiales bacterium]|jgi:NADPH-dependent F420 reductase|nr:NADPH-dependent F420 reductase [Acidimicrobiales bacterium]
MRVGILGGTGPAGRGLAARLAAAGVNVVVGSRSAERAAATCEEIRTRWPQHQMWLEPVENREAADAQVVVVATPWDAAASTTESVADLLGGKVVVSMANALAKKDGELQAVTPPSGSVAAAVQEAAPGAMVAAAFHHVPARSLAAVDTPIDGDVIVCTDHQPAFEATAQLVRMIPGLRPLHGGSLVGAGPVEAFTAVLLGVNSRYKARAVVRLNGIPG